MKVTSGVRKRDGGGGGDDEGSKSKSKEEVMDEWWRYIEKGCRKGNTVAVLYPRRQLGEDWRDEVWVVSTKWVKVKRSSPFFYIYFSWDEKKW